MSYGSMLDQKRPFIIEMSLELIRSKSILNFFSLSEDEFSDLENHIYSVDEGEVIVKQGSILDSVIIPISMSFLLEIRLNDVLQRVGTIIPGRSVNLYNYLNGIPLSYTCRAEAAGEYLKIPKATFDRWLEKHGTVKAYLLKVTEDSDIRSLAKNWIQSGLSQDLVFDTIASVTYKTSAAHDFVFQANKAASSAVFLVEGKFLIYDGKNNIKSWLLPLKSWHFFRESLSDEKPNYSIVSVEKSRYFEISNSDLLRLKKIYDEEFNSLLKYILEGLEAPSTDEDSGDEHSVDELFASAQYKNTWRFNFPFVKQNDEMDCGPACMAMISDFFGRKLSIQFWRSRLSTDRNGTSLYDLAVTTEKSGFISHCLEVKNLKDVDSFLFPFVICRKYHYLVVYKIKKNTAIVGDPAYGIREMKLDELQDGMEPVGLFLKPNADFYKNEDSPSPWIHYIKLFNGLEKEITLAFVCSFLGVIFSMIPPLVSQLAIDEILTQKDTSMLWFLLGGCVVITILTHLINWAKNYYFIFIMNKFNFRSTSIFMQKLFSLPYNFFSTRHIGDFTHRISEIAQLRSFVTGTLFKVILNLLTIVFYSAVLMMINRDIALIVMGLMPLMVIIPVLFTRKLDRQYQEIFTKSSEQSSYLTDLIEGVSVIKSSGAELTSRIRFEDKLIDFVKSQNAFALTNAKVNFFSGSYLQASQFALMGISVFYGINGEITAGQVISISLLANQMFSPLQSIAEEWEQFVKVKSTLSRLNDIFLADSENASTTTIQKNKKFTQFKGEIEFKNVWFRYGGEGSDWVLKNINFKIEPGQKVAIVGPSGSGKSTLAALLTRMYEPTEGSIFIDGRDYREYDINWLRKQIGMLQQENRLFSGTLRENIAISDLDSHEQKLISAAENAVALDLVEKKSGVWNHYVPHGGLGFSGGEKQKIALMRLFYKQPSIIILDEATSALDGISEREIINNIQNILKSNTVINIAHRFSTVKFSDYVLVLNDGKIVGYGTIEHLKSNNAIFSNLFGFSDDEDSEMQAEDQDGIETHSGDKSDKKLKVG